MFKPVEIFEPRDTVQSINLRGKKIEQTHDRLHNIMLGRPPSAVITSKLRAFNHKAWVWTMCLSRPFRPLASRIQAFAGHYQSLFQAFFNILVMTELLDKMYGRINFGSKLVSRGQVSQITECFLSCLCGRLCSSCHTE